MLNWLRYWRPFRRLLLKLPSWDWLLKWLYPDEAEIHFKEGSLPIDCPHGGKHEWKSECPNGMNA